MARIKSALKNIRKNGRRNAINRARRSQLRTRVRRMRTLIAKKDAQASVFITETVSTIDRAVRKGVLHRNAAARHKSRLMKGVAAAEKSR
ncbi:MAG TPA: 30S ribosomal protein S20 [Patescibacteria group bacterium]|nr:30S ribosomal protein S20 [Patescibacteria group bacterium]